MHAHRGRLRPWHVVLAAGVTASVGYFGVSAEAQETLTNLIGAAAVAAIAFGIRRNRPVNRPGWILLAAGIAIYLLGDVAWTLLSPVGGVPPFPSQADALYIAAQALIVVAVVRLAGFRERGWYRPALFDGTLVAGAFALVLWAAFYGTIAKTAESDLALAVAASYPLLDLVLVGVIVAHLNAGTGRSPSMLLLLAGATAWLVGDLAYTALSVTDTYVPGSAVDAGWLLGYVLLATAAVHPASGYPESQVTDETDHLSDRRLALIGLSIAVTIAAISLKGAHATGAEWVALTLLLVVMGSAGVGRLLGALHRSRVLLGESRALHAELDRRARTDPLTGLTNRAVVAVRLEAALAARAGVALLYLDLDDFKGVNDAWGHATGDELLRSVGERLRSVVRDADDVARLGGDEFTLVVAPCPDPDTAKRVAERVLAGFVAPVLVGPHAMRVRPSIGVVWSSDPAVPAEALLQQADIAMYQAKAGGGARIAIYEPTMRDRAVEQASLRADLEAAIDRGELHLAYQPIVSLHDGDVVAVEALARWDHAVRGAVPPATFVAIAEATGLMGRLTRLILRLAVDQLAAWHSLGAGRIRLHVNVSPSDVSDGELVAVVSDALAATGVAADRLVLELTETALVDPGAARPTLEALKRLGVGLALDDFGSRYAVLGNLLDLPFDSVKLDRSITRQLGNPTGDRLVGGIVRLAESLGLESVAEGVEDDSALAMLRRMGCTHAQGYAIARPETADAAGRRLAAASISRPGAAGDRRPESLAS